MSHRRSVAVTVVSVAAMFASAAAAHAATLTQPTNGATVSLKPNFSWTMGANELVPQVLLSRTPTYGGNVDTACSDGDPDTPVTSCTSVSPLDDGTWYAYVQTSDSDTNQPIDSPLVRIAVRAEIGFGFTDPWGGNPATIVQTESAPGVVGEIRPGVLVISPFSTVQVSGWLNDPGAKITVSYTVRHRHRVVSRATHIQHAGGEEDWGFNLESFFLLHVRGVATGTRLSCTIILRGDGARAQKTVKIRNPPPGGRIVHKH